MGSEREDKLVVFGVVKRFPFLNANLSRHFTCLLALCGIVYFVQPSFAETPTPPASTPQSDSLFAPAIAYNPLKACTGECSFSVYTGKFVDTSMADIFTVSNSFTPPWRWKFGQSELAAATFSRKLLENPGWWSIEGEIGAAKRFGDLNSTETWVALYFRWSAFPWSKWVRTSIGVSTGLNLAWSLDSIENERASTNGNGSHLMHFLSPEMTLGLPDHPEWDVFVRYHHRSGAETIIPPVSDALFNNTTGGAQYISIGFRYHF